jgi:DsbC/DsbD-like thiol-disulfide interchange protein
MLGMTAMKTAIGYGLGALMLLSAADANAEVSDWSVSEGGRVRLSALSDREPGKLTAVLEIEPAAGWKTYWQEPGDSGLPPQIDLSSAENLKAVSYGYAVPEIGRDEAGRFIGYHGPASIVINLQQIRPGEKSMLSANILVGFCKNICLPFQSHFELPLDQTSQPKADEFMTQQMAKAALPEAPSASFDVKQSGLADTNAVFQATVVVPGTEMPDIAAAPSEGLLLGKPTVIIDAGVAEVRYPVTRLPKSLTDASITLLVKSGGRAMETKLAVK